MKSTQNERVATKVHDPIINQNRIKSEKTDETNVQLRSMETTSSSARKQILSEDQENTSNLRNIKYNYV